MPVVLVVEDNPMNRKLLRDILEIRFEVDEAPTAEDALGLLARRRPDLILLDLQLPGMDGLELVRRLKADPDRKDIPVIAVSAHALKSTIDEALASGCLEYITKPLVEDPFVFVDRLARLMAPPASKSLNAPGPRR
jgi:CheY-like chemotaxis protein